MSQKAFTVTTSGTTESVFPKMREDNTAVVQVAGTFTGFQFAIEGSLDGTNYTPLAAIKLADGTLVTGTINANATTGSYLVPNAGNYPLLRLNVSQLSTGSVAGFWYSSNQQQMPYVNVSASGTFTNGTFSGTLSVTGATTLSSTVSIGDNTTIADGKNIILNATTGTKIGTATTQKLGFFNATPIVQPIGTVELVTVLTSLGLAASGAHPLTLNGLLTLTDVNVALGTSTGTILGTATTQKLGFYGTTAIVQPTANGTQATAAAGSTTNVFLNTTMTGGVGSTGYTVGDVVKCLKQSGLIAQ